MPQLKVRNNRPGINASTVNRIVRPKRVVLTQVSNNKLRLAFPYGPTTVDFAQLGIAYKEIVRPQQKPILVPENQQLRTVSFTVLIADKATGGLRSVGEALDTLEKMASEDIDLNFRYGLISLPFPVRITQYSYSSVQRDNAGNILKASVKVQLTERVSIRQKVTALTAVSYSSVPTPQPTPSGGGSSSGSSTPAPTPDAPAPNKWFIGCQINNYSDRCNALSEERDNTYWTTG